MHKFSVIIPGDQIEETVEKLTFYGYYQLVYEQPIEQFVEPNGYGFKEVQANVELSIFVESHFQKDEILQDLTSILNRSIEYEQVQHQDWQQPFPTIDLNNGWFIQPPSHDEKLNGKVIYFEPPRAFGSGLHNTTQDCLRIILDYDLTNQKVLDVGTGAGLLSIAAAIAGSNDVTAIDIEDVKEEVMYNATLNGVANQINVKQADVLQPKFHLDEKFHWMFINIGGEESIQLLPFVKKHLDNGGKLILSGMVTWNYEEVLAIYENNGFNVLQVFQNEEWVTAILVNA